METGFRLVIKPIYSGHNRVLGKRERVWGKDFLADLLTRNFIN